MEKLRKALNVKIHCPKGKKHVGNTYCHDCDREDAGFATYGVYQVQKTLLKALMVEMEREIKRVLIKTNYLSFVEQEAVRNGMCIMLDVLRKAEKELELLQQQ